MNLWRGPVVALFILSCTRERVPPPSQGAELPEGAFARVGAKALNGDLLLAGQLEPQSVVHDVLFAEDARQRLPHRASSAERGILARALLQKLRQEVLQGKELHPSDLEAQRQANWLMFDRPRAVRAIAVGVVVPPLVPEPPYLELARTMRTACQDALGVDDLIEAVTKVKEDYPDFEIHPRRLPPLAQDGRIVPVVPQDREPLELDPRIAQHAIELTEPGQMSPVFATEQEFLFLFSTEVMPAIQPPESEIREQLLNGIAAPEVDRRATRIAEAGRSQVKFSSKDLSALLELLWRRQ